MSRIVLVVAAHPDDEALGCGGTIARHVAEGDLVCALFLADGVNSRPDANAYELKRRAEAAKAAHAVLGISEARFLDFPDNRLDTIPLLDIIKKIEITIEDFSPHVIYTHHQGDLNVDHQVAHRAVLTACRPIPRATVREIYAFELMSSTEWASPDKEPFLPSHFVDISDFVAIKRKALEAYHIEMRERPHSRSMEHLECLWRHRGYSVGVEAAEAFATVRSIR